MANAPAELLSRLESTINAAAGSLPRVSSRRMFGCHALFADDAVFGLVWKEGRIGVRLPNDEAFERLMSQQGAHPWTAGNMQMSHWVLVPEMMHDDPAQLSHWLALAHQLALESGPQDTGEETAGETPTAKPRKTAKKAKKAKKKAAGKKAKKSTAKKAKKSTGKKAKKATARKAKKSTGKKAKKSTAKKARKSTSKQAKKSTTKKMTAKKPTRKKRK